MSNAHLVALVGPTAAGKSAVAMRLAQSFGMQIVSADAFCAYRGMDIGTAKPSVEDRDRVQHHLIDTHDVQETVDVAGYQLAARRVIDGLLAQGITPLLVGGSGLYVQAVLDDLRFPGTDPVVRAELEEELAERGPDALHARLHEVDPQAAARILPGNGRRIVRALEVNQITGGPFTAELGDQRPWRPSTRIGWDPGVELVDAAIARRVDLMWEAGFVNEVRELSPRMGRTAAGAVGYRQILDALVEGTDPDEAREPTVTATRRLARKQRKWFRRDRNIRWAHSVADIEQIVGALDR